MIRTTTLSFTMNRRLTAARPQPPRQPKFVAVALAGVFAIVPAGLLQAIPSGKMPQVRHAGEHMMNPCDCP